MSRCLPAGHDTAVQQALHKEGVAAVLAPEFAPKRDRQADRRASPGYGRRGGLEIGETQVPASRRRETSIPHVTKVPPLAAR